MTTTDNWREANASGSVHIHISTHWLLVNLEGLANLEGPVDLVTTGWYLIGREIVGLGFRADPGDNSPAVNLLLASRVADEYIDCLKNGEG